MLSGIYSLASHLVNVITFVVTITRLLDKIFVSHRSLGSLLLFYSRGKNYLTLLAYISRSVMNISSLASLFFIFEYNLIKIKKER